MTHRIGYFKMRKKTNKKPPTVASLKKKLWPTVSRVIRQMYLDYRGFATCVTCGKASHWKEMDAGHFIAKNKGAAVYFECSNIHPQCRACNLFLRGNLVAYTLWMQNHYGMDEVIRLQALARTVKKFTRGELLEMIKHWKQCEREL